VLLPLVLILLVLPALVERFSLHLPPEDRGPHGRDIGHHTEEGEPA
jgi:cobalt-zinc-cadmium resistance protein CzcA